MDSQCFDSERKDFDAPYTDPSIPPRANFGYSAQPSTSRFVDECQTSYNISDTRTIPHFTPPPPGLFDTNSGYRRPNDNFYAPSTFSGRSVEDANEYLAYV